MAEGASGAPQPQDDAAEAGGDPLLLFRLGASWFALAAQHVELVLPNDLARTRVPTAPRHVPGVVNHRGRALALLDAEAFLSLGVEGLGSPPRLVVVEAAGMSVALPVREIEGIRRLGVRPSPTPLPYTRGLVDLEQGAAQVLDAPALLAAAALGGAS